jgi:hypothetical protein
MKRLVGATRFFRFRFPKALYDRVNGSKSLEKRGKFMPRKTGLPKGPAEETDPEQLHMMDENNTKWVKQWKQTAKTKNK